MKTLGMIALVLTFGLAGCSQQTKSDPVLNSDAAQVGTQDQAAQGSASHVNVYIQNVPDYQGVDRGGNATNDPAAGVEGVSTDGNGNVLARAAATFAQSGITLNIHTGGSTTGQQSATGPGSQAQNPGSSVSQTPNQEPSASLAVPISVAMPGGAASGSASAAGPSGTASLTADQRASLSTLFTQAAKGDAGALSIIQEFLKSGKLPPVTEAPKP